MVRLRPALRLLDRPRGNPMGYPVLERALRELKRLAFKPLLLTWTGQPTRIGIDAFAACLGLADALLAGRVRHSLRTDGVQITEGWVQLLRWRKLEVVLTLLGPAELHDPYRGTGSHSLAEGGLGRLHRSGIPVRVECPVTPRSLPWAESVLEYFDRLGVAEVDFLPQVSFPDGQVKYSLEPGEFGRFLYRVYLHAPRRRVRVRSLVALERRMLCRTCDYCRFGEHCWTHVTIAADGSVYPCEDFSQLDGYRLGNILEDNLDSILRSDAAHRVFSGWAQTPSACHGCPYESMCLGGCPMERLASEDPASPSALCEDWRALYEGILADKGHCLQFDDTETVMQWTRRRPSSN